MVLGALLVVSRRRSQTTTSGTVTDEGGVGTPQQLLAGLIEDQLAEERLRKPSLEARGLALITSSGAFTTLVLALAALVQPETLPGPSRALLVAAAVAFLGAALTGAWVNAPAEYGEPKAVDLLDRTSSNRWNEAGIMSARRVANSNAKSLQTARQRNDEKACRLSWGARAQMTGMALVGLAAIIVLI